MRFRSFSIALLGAALACDDAPAPISLRFETITTDRLDLDSVPSVALVEHEGSVIADWIMASRRATGDQSILSLADGRRLRIAVEGDSTPVPLMLAVSADDSTWTPVAVLEEASAPDPRPALMRAADGTVHLTYALDATRFRHLALRLR